MILRDYQERAIAAVREHYRAGRKRVLLVMATGGGKCLGIGTPVLRYDGTIVPVESVVAGDLLMGPDSKPRTVLSTTRDRGPLYRIVPVKGDSWVCNDAHILTLVHTETGEIVDIGLQDYLAESKNFKHLHKQFAPETGVDFAPSEPLPLDPYFVGVWYGDGTKALDSVAVSKPDSEIVALCDEMAERFGLRRSTYEGKTCPTHRITGGGGRNALLDAMRRVYGDGDRLPRAYLVASRSDRASFLAGLLDSDGHHHNGCYEITQKRKAWADDVMFLARSLGFRASMSEKVVNGTSYWRVLLCGEASWLPLRIQRKRAEPRRQTKRVTRTGFNVESIGVGEYAGFTLDGDGRFLLGDFTVTHNTATASALLAAAVARGNRCTFVVHRREIVLDTARRLREQGLRVGVVMAGVPFDAEALVHVCSIQTIAARGLQIPADLVVWDEAHHVAAGTYAALREQYPQAWHLGLTATPMRADGAGLSDAFDAIVVGATVRELQLRGALVPFDALVPASAGKGFATTAELAYHEYARTRAAVIFCGTVERGREVAAATALPLIHGGTHAEERDACLRAFAAGEVPGVVNVAVLTEGWDCARADCVVLERNCSSVGTYLQIVGRILRANPADPSKRALLIDLGSNVTTHGLPSDERVYSLDGKPIRRTETETVPLCAMCGATRRDGDRECWRCGVVYPQRKKPQVRNVPLVDYTTLSPEDRREMQAAHLRLLERTAQERNYKKSWVSYRFYARWGVWPEQVAS